MDSELIILFAFVEIVMDESTSDELKELRVDALTSTVTLSTRTNRQKGGKQYAYRRFTTANSNQPLSNHADLTVTSFQSFTQRQDFFQLGNDAFLFSKGGEGKGNCAEGTMKQMTGHLHLPFFHICLHFTQEEKNVFHVNFVGTNRLEKCHILDAKFAFLFN